MPQPVRPFLPSGWAWNTVIPGRVSAASKIAALANRNGTWIGVIATLVATYMATQNTVAQDWPQWRGKIGDNHAADDSQIVNRWNLETGENILWKTKIPGRGHSTPAIVGEEIFLTTAVAEDETQSLLKLDLRTGKILESITLHRGTLPRRIHPNNSYASPSPAVADDAVYVSFHTNDSIVLSKVSTEGRIWWQQKVADFKPSMFQFGYGASPIIEDDLVIVAAEYDGPGSGIYALNRSNGRRIWKISRPRNLNFSSPIVAEVAGRRQLLIAGADTITSYDPVTGKTIWSVDAGTEAHCGTVVWDRRRIVASGGNPRSNTWCVAGDGVKGVLWKNNVKCYEQSPLAVDGFVYAVSDNGVGYCWRMTGGTEMWKQRLFRGPVSASPLLVGRQIVAAGERGMVRIFSATPDRFEAIAEIQTGDSIFASPVVVDDRLYLRTGVGTGRERTEYLVSIGG